MLCRVQPGIGAVGGKQFVVIALLYDAPVLEDQNDIGVPYGRQSVRHHECRPSIAQLLQACLHPLFGFGIQR